MRRALFLLALSGCLPESTLTSSAPARATWEAGRLRLLTGRYATQGSDAEAAARAFLTTHAGELGLELDHGALELAATRHGLTGDYLRFTQLHRGLPVFDGEVVVHLDAAHAQVLGVNVAVRPRASEVQAGPEPGAAAAERAALEHLGVSAPFSFGPQTSEGIWAPDRGAVVKAYRVRVSTDEPRGAWEIYVSGALEVLAVRNRLRPASGTAMVFDPNPVVTTGDTTLVDNNDATNATLDGARFAVTMPRLDGSGFTRGSYADATTKNQNNRVSSATLDFNFTRNQSFNFEQANAYFHLDRVQDRIQTALGFNNVNNRVQTVVVDGQNADNSFYDSNSLKIFYGTGGVDDAEDADIVTHEYGHSIQDNQVPNFGAGGDEGAMGEGFGDYLAASSQLALGTAAGRPVGDPACVGEWDSTAYSNTGCLRRTDGTKHWPEASDGEVHDDGEMWSASLWGIRQILGGDPADQLVLEAQFMMSTSDTMQLASDALIAADQALFDGGSALPIQRRLIAQGVSRTLTVADAGASYVSYPASLDNPRSTAGLYADNLDDTVTFTAPGATSLKVHFATIDTERDPSCLAGGCDNIYLTNADGDLFDLLNGQQTNVTSAAIAGDTVHLRLVTDLNTDKFGYHVDAILVEGAFDGGFVLPDGGGFDAGQPADAGQPPDAGLPDAGAPDAGAPDAGPGDSGAPDAGGADSGVPDSGTGGGAGGGGGSASGGGSATGGGSAAGGGSATGGGAAVGGGAGGGGQSKAKSGCGCTETGAGELGLLALGWLGALKRRRQVTVRSRRS